MRYEYNSLGLNGLLSSRRHTRSILVSLAMAACLVSCKLQQPHTLSYLATSKVHIASDSSSISCLLPEATVTFPIKTIRRESLYSNLLITTTQRQFEADRYWYRDMGGLPKKYLNGNAQMLFSLSGYMTAYVVDTSVQQAVKAPIHCTYIAVNFHIERNLTYMDYWEDWPNYSSQQIFRTVVEDAKNGTILLIDQKYMTNGKTLVIFYLIHSGTTGCIAAHDDTYGYQIYLGSRSRSYTNPIHNKCSSYETIRRVFDPILDEAEIQTQNTNLSNS